MFLSCNSWKRFNKDCELHRLRHPTQAIRIQRDSWLQPVFPDRHRLKTVGLRTRSPPEARPALQVDPERAFAYNPYSTVNAYSIAASDSTALFALWRCAPMLHQADLAALVGHSLFDGSTQQRADKSGFDQRAGADRNHAQRAHATFSTFLSWFGGFYDEV